jgi:YgiT-type zinc finger domain-containing protein
MRCSIRDCSGEYQSRQITHTVRHRGRVVVIDGVPADVCSVCGDVLLMPATVRRIEEMLEAAPVPSRTAPIYEYTA